MPGPSALSGNNSGERMRSNRLMVSYRRSLRSLDTGYFSVVMSNGIISISLFYHHYYFFSFLFFYFGVVSFALLSALFVFRLLIYRDHFIMDIGKADCAFPLFNTLTAASVMFTRYLMTAGKWTYGITLLYTIEAAWLLLTLVLLAEILLSSTESISVSSNWFSLMVSMESLSILTAIFHEVSSFTAGNWELPLSYWVAGILSYSYVAFHTIRKLVVHGLEEREVVGPFWINMGGAALISLSGMLFLEGYTNSAPNFVTDVVHLSIIISLSWSVLWFPVLVTLNVRDIVADRETRRYRPSFWSILFPIGMLSVALYKSQTVLHLDALTYASSAILYLAIILWACVLILLLLKFKDDVETNNEYGFVNRRSWK